MAVRDCEESSKTVRLVTDGDPVIKQNYTTKMQSCKLVSIYTCVIIYMGRSKVKTVLPVYFSYATTRREPCCIYKHGKELEEFQTTCTKTATITSS